MSDQSESSRSTVAFLPAGFRLGDFELRGVLPDDDAGADTVLYRAWDPLLARPVAIAEYLPRGLVRRERDGTVEPVSSAAAAAFAEGIERFVDDARMFADIDHPSLLHVLQLVQAHGTAYRVMPWYRGAQLMALRRRMAAPPDETALRALLEELLGALQALHRKGRVHAGVHPARILMRDDDQALLLGPHGPVQGASSFLAPEQLRHDGGAAVGPWTDFHALAKVARFCISGELPNECGATPDEPLAAVAAGLRFSPAFLNALDLAASPEPHRRPQSVAQFRAWLDQPPHEAAPLPEVPGEPTADGELNAATMLAIQRAIESIPSAAAAPLGVSTPTPPGLGAGLAPTVADVSRLADADAPMPVPMPAEASLQPSQYPHDVSVGSSGAPSDVTLDIPLDFLSADGGLRVPAAPPPAKRWRALAVAGLVAGLVVMALGVWLVHEPTQQMVAGILAPDPAPRAALPASPARTIERPSQSADVPAAATPSAVALRDTVPPAKVSAVADDGVDPAPPAPSAPQSVRADIEPGSLPAPGAGNATPIVPTAAAAPAASTAAPARPTSPRQLCGDRTQFALYRCVQRYCEQAQWKTHAQCVRLRETDEVE